MIPITDIEVSTAPEMEMDEVHYSGRSNQEDENYCSDVEPERHPLSSDDEDESIVIKPNVR